MPREEVSGSGGGKKRVQDDRHAGLPTDAPEKDPSGSQAWAENGIVQQRGILRSRMIRLTGRQSKLPTTIRTRPPTPF